MPRWLQTPKSFNLRFQQEIRTSRGKCLLPGKQRDHRIQLSYCVLNKNINFKSYIENICSKANDKTRALF